MIDVRITDEAYDRMNEALGEIEESCDTNEIYTEWYDIAQMCIVEILEDLDDLQIYRTCAAFEEYVRDKVDTELNKAKGIAKSLEAALIDYVNSKDKFITAECNLDDDDYDSSEAVQLKSVFLECCNSATELCSEIGA